MYILNFNRLSGDTKMIQSQYFKSVMDRSLSCAEDPQAALAQVVCTMSILINMRLSKQGTPKRHFKMSVPTRKLLTHT